MRFPSWTTRRLFRAALVVLTAGVAMVLASSGQIAEIIGGGLIGISAVLFVSFAFLLVGESEDRERARG